MLKGFALRLAVAGVVCLGLAGCTTSHPRVVSTPTPPITRLLPSRHPSPPPTSCPQRFTVGVRAYDYDEPPGPLYVPARSWEATTLHAGMYYFVWAGVARETGQNAILVVPQPVDLCAAVAPYNEGRSTSTPSYPSHIYPEPAGYGQLTLTGVNGVNVTFQTATGVRGSVNVLRGTFSPVS